MALYRSVIHVGGDGALPFAPPVRKLGHDKNSCRWIVGVVSEWIGTVIVIIVTIILILILILIVTVCRF